MYYIKEQFKNEKGYIEYIYTDLSIKGVLEHLPRAIDDVNYYRTYKHYNSAKVELYRGNTLIFSTSTLRGKINSNTVVKLWMDSIRPNRSEKPSFLDKVEIINTISIMFDGEKINNSRGELYSVKVKNIWGEPRYIVVHQRENPSEFSVDIYDYYNMLQTRVFTTKTAMSPIAYEIGQYVIEYT